VDIELERYNLKLAPNIGLMLLDNKNLLKIIEDLQEVGDIRGKDPGDLLKLLRRKWNEEEEAS
jgi:hypothetical protein